MFMAPGSYPGKPEHNSADGKESYDPNSMSLAFHHLLHHPISLHTHKSMGKHPSKHTAAQTQVTMAYSMLFQDLIRLFAKT